jgi:CBS domain-containing protein
MSKDVLVASPDDTIEKAATLMAQVTAAFFPSGKNDRLVGMVTDRDTSRFAPSRRGTPRSLQSTRRHVVWDHVRF